MFIAVSKQGRYAKVLLSFCKDEVQAVDAYETLRLLSAVLERRYKRLPRFLNANIIEGVLNTVVTSLVKHKDDEHVSMLKKFLLFLNQSKRMDMLEKITFAFQQLMVIKFGSISVNMEVSPHMSKEQLSDIKDFISSRLKKRVSYRVLVDAKKLMGFSVSIMRNVEIHANFANFIKKIQNENCH